MLDRLRQYSRHEPFVVICLLVAAVAFNLVSLYSSFSVEVSTGTDMLLHTLLVEAVVDAVKSGQNFTDPWQGSMGMGHPMFHYYQHLPHVALGLFQVLTFGVFPADELVNWSTYLLISIFPLSIYWSLRRFGFDQLTSAMGGLVASLIATNGISGFGYVSYIGSAQGLYSQLWAMVLLPPALAWGYLVLKEGRGYFWAVLLIAATLLSHVLYGYMAFLTLGILTLLLPIRFKLPWNMTSLPGRSSGTRSQRRRANRSNRPRGASAAAATDTETPRPSVAAMYLVQFRRLAILFLLVVAVTSYFLVPLFLDLRFFNSSELIDPLLYDSHGHSVVLNGLFKGDLFDFGRFPSLTILVFAGFAVCLARWRTTLFLIPVILFLLWLLLYFGRPTWGSLTNVLPLSQDILMFRFIGGVHLGGIFLIAVALGASWRWVISQANIRYTVAALVVTVLILLPVYVERRSELQANTHLLVGCQSGERTEEPDVNALFEELNGLPQGRVYAGQFKWFEQHWGDNYTTGCTLFQSKVLSEGLNMMGSLYHRYSLTSDVMDDFDESRWEQYNLFNVRYVIAPEEIRFPEFVQPLKQFGRHTLYQVETTGYFDLVGSDLAFAGDKDDFFPAASAWLASGLPTVKQYPVVSMSSTSNEIPTPLAQALQIISEAALPPIQGRGAVLGEEIGNNYFEADVLVERESVLLLKASYHPNWRATVNGVEIEPIMLMPSFLGINLTPGEHHVRFEYQPGSLRLVLLVSGLILLALIAVVERRRDSISDWLRPRVLARFGRSDKCA